MNGGRLRRMHAIKAARFGRPFFVTLAGQQQLL